MCLEHWGLLFLRNDGLVSDEAVIEEKQEGERQIGRVCSRGKATEGWGQVVKAKVPSLLLKKKKKVPLTQKKPCMIM